MVADEYQPTRAVPVIVVPVMSVVFVAAAFGEPLVATIAASIVLFAVA